MTTDSGDLHVVIQREVRTTAGDRETLLLTPVRKNLFRLEHISFITGAVYHDVIRTTETDDGALLFVEIAERSPLETYTWILSQEVIQSDALQPILKQIMDEGGSWEQVFGGALIVHTPPTVAREIENQIRRIVDQKTAEPS